MFFLIRHDVSLIVVFVLFFESESAPAALTITFIFPQCFFCKCSAMIRPKMARNCATEHPASCRRSNRAYAGADSEVEKACCEAWGSILTIFGDFPAPRFYTEGTLAAGLDADACKSLDEAAKAAGVATFRTSV